MNQYQLNIARILSHRYAQTTSFPWDDLFQEACAAYLEAAHKHDATRGQLATFTWRVMESKLLNLIRNEQKTVPQVAMDELLDGDALDPGELLPSGAPTPDRAFGFKEALESLGPEARGVCDFVLGWVPCPVRQPNAPSQPCNAYLNLARIREELLSVGWSHGQLARGIKEVRGLFRSGLLEIEPHGV